MDIPENDSNEDKRVIMKLSKELENRASTIKELGAK